MLRLVLIVFLFIFGSATLSEAHFGMIIPSSSTVTQKNQSKIALMLAFAHPMERNGMNMEMPKNFAVFTDGKQLEDLKPLLKSGTFLGHKAWQATWQITRPGVYHFAVTPEPYFEPAEDCFIVHYTKAIVPAFGEEEGWDMPLGLKTEIVPLTRPFGNYAGNLFRGQVLLDGKPVAGADVEVEFYNKDGKRKAPNDYYVTQVVKTDAQGIFTYAVPWSGWWGFAALSTAPDKMDYKGEAKNVELGAVLWLEFANPVTK